MSTSCVSSVIDMDRTQTSGVTIIGASDAAGLIVDLNRRAFGGSNLTDFDMVTAANVARRRTTVGIARRRNLDMNRTQDVGHGIEEVPTGSFHAKPPVVVGDASKTICKPSNE